MDVLRRVLHWASDYGPAIRSVCGGWWAAAGVLALPATLSTLAARNHLSLIEWVVELRGGVLPTWVAAGMFAEAARAGHAALAAAIQAWGGLPEALVLSTAVRVAELDFVRLFVPRESDSDHGGDRAHKQAVLREVFALAGGLGRGDVMRELKERVAGDPAAIESAFNQSARRGQLATVMLCKEWGARDYYGAIMSADSGDAAGCPAAAALARQWRREVEGKDTYPPPARRADGSAWWPAGLR